MPFIFLVLCGTKLGFFNERGESSNGFVWKAELLRQLFVEPDAFFLFGSFRRSVP